MPRMVLLNSRKPGRDYEQGRGLAAPRGTEPEGQRWPRGGQRAGREQSQHASQASSSCGLFQTALHQNPFCILSPSLAPRSRRCLTSFAWAVPPPGQASLHAPGSSPANQCPTHPSMPHTPASRIFFSCQSEVTTPSSQFLSRPVAPETGAPKLALLEKPVGGWVDGWGIILFLKNKYSKFFGILC